jgi:hypothetical protein
MHPTDGGAKYTTRNCTFTLGASASLASTVIDHAFLIATLFLLDYFLWLYLRAILSRLPQLCDMLLFLLRVCWWARVVFSVASSVKSRTQSSVPMLIHKDSEEH